MSNKFLQKFPPDRDISVDECLMKFRGRLSYIQFNSSKRGRFGIRIYKLCESSTGYYSVFEIYTGKKVLPKGQLVIEQIDLQLTEPFLDKGYIMHIVNWYSLPSLFLNLL